MTFLPADKTETTVEADTKMLTWWRTLSPAELKPARGKAEELIEYLKGLTQTTNNRVSELMPQAVAGVASATFALGCELSNRQCFADDLAMSWILSAALYDHAAAQLYIAQELVRQTSDEFHNRETFEFEFPFHPHDMPKHTLTVADIKLLRLARAWALKVPPIPNYRRYLAKEFYITPENDNYQNPGSTLELSGHPTLRVIEKIAESAHRETKDLVKLYSNLTTPLPLAGAGLTPEILEATLNSEFPWMADVTARIAGDVRLMQICGSPWFRFRPILLLGPAGVGKTRYAGRLAHLTGAGFGVVSVGGSADNRMFAGTARGWSSAQPSYPLLVMSQSECANPIIVIDEIDKAGGDGRNGRVHDTLLGMLEPVTAKAWFDEALLAPADLRQVSWIATANDISWMPQTLLSRLAVIEVTGPSEDALDTILVGIRHDLAQEFNTEPDFLPELHPQARDMLAEAFASGCSIRRLKSAYVSAIAKGQAPNRTLH